EMHAGTTADIDFVLVADNQISGRVVDASGMPIKGVCVQLQPTTGEASNSFHRSYSNSDGRYVLSGMPPGQYLLTAELFVQGKPGQPRLFYPGTAERKGAQVVTIGTGEHITGFDIHMPK